MGNLRWEIAFFTDANRLADAFKDVRGFIAHVGMMHSAHCSSDFLDLDHLLSRSEIPGNVEEAGGHAKRSIEHCFACNLAHFVDFFRRRRTIHESHNLLANAALPRKGAKIGAERQLANIAQKFADWKRRASVRS